jgi:hypothetical protein
MGQEDMMGPNKTGKSVKATHPAENYNRIRRIILNAADKDIPKARDWLCGYKKSLGPKGHAGLAAELEFYTSFRKDYRLIPTLDYGDATDFAGEIEGRMFRIDVTTSLKFKQLEDYEPYQTNGDRYKIALLTGNDFELIDINFPFCTQCSYGRIFGVGLLHGQNYKNEKPTWTNDQSLIDVCGSCGHYSIVSRVTSHNFPDFDDVSSGWWEQLGLDDVSDDDDPAERQCLRDEHDCQIRAYSVSSLQYLKEEFSTFLVAIGSPGYKITGRRGEGHYAVKPRYVENLVSSRFLDEFEFDFDDLPDGKRKL